MRKQFKPTLSKSLNKHRRGLVDCNGVRFITFALMTVAGISIFLNLRMISLPQAENQSLTSLPNFSFPTYPASFSKTRTPIEKDEELAEWDNWAESPVVGSYKFDKGTVIHYPYMDLQSHYHDTKPHFVRGGSSAFLKNAKFPDPFSGVLTRKGNKFMASGVKSNQDRVAILSFPQDDFWIGLFDGHGAFGHVSSQYASLEFPKHLVHVQSTSDPIDAIKGIFRDIQQSLPFMPEAGSTAISVWKRRDQLYISNIGDSTAFIASFDDSGAVKIVYVTKPHKPDTPEERARIESVGGQVIDPPMPGLSARLLIADPNPEKSMALAMSRSLGDFEGEKFGLSSEPTTDTLDLKALDQSKNYMVVAASDGLLDRVNMIKVATAFAQSLLPTKSLLPLEAAEQLILESSDAWRMDAFGEGYRDDISVAVHRIQL